MPPKAAAPKAKAAASVDHASYQGKIASISPQPRRITGANMAFESPVSATDRRSFGIFGGSFSDALFRHDL